MNELMLSCVHLISLEGHVQAALVPRRVLCAILGLLYGSSWHTVNLVVHDSGLVFFLR